MENISYEVMACNRLKILFIFMINFTLYHVVLENSNVV